jgi:hypothetical protein
MASSGLATGLLLTVAAVYFAYYALNGGLQTDLATDAPPEWAFAQYAVLSGIVVLYLLAAAAFTVVLAVVQIQSGPWWAVLGGMCALAAGVGLFVAGSPFTYVGFAGYIAATNAVGIRARQFGGATAATGLTSAVLLLAAPLAAGFAGGVLLALALGVLFYGVWAVWVGVSAWRPPASARTTAAPLRP